VESQIAKTALEPLSAPPPTDIFNHTLYPMPAFHCKVLKKRLAKRIGKIKCNHAHKFRVVRFDQVFNHFVTSFQCGKYNFDFPRRNAVESKCSRLPRQQLKSGLQP